MQFFSANESFRNTYGTTSMIPKAHLFGKSRHVSTFGTKVFLRSLVRLKFTHRYTTHFPPTTISLQKQLYTRHNFTQPICLTKANRHFSSIRQNFHQQLIWQHQLALYQRITKRGKKKTLVVLTEILDKLRRHWCVHDLCIFSPSFLCQNRYM